MSLLYESTGNVRWPFRLFFSHRLFPSATDHPTETMAACAYDEHGDSSKLTARRIARPVPVAGQVLIRVVGAGCNPVDVKLRENPIPRFYLPLPKVPGTDISGVVVRSPGGSAFSAGDRVVAMLPIEGSTWGACEEYVAVDESLVARAPTNTPLLHAAALPLVGLTVVQAMEPVVRAFGGQTEGKTVLVHAASGGVGSIAVQYCAHVLGMRVVATCSAANAQFVRDLGASQVIDYKKEKFEAVLGPESCDVVIDVLAYLYEERAWKAKLLKTPGHYVVIASSPWEKGPESGADPLGFAIPEARVDRLLVGYTRSFLSKTLYSQRRHFVFVRPDGKQLAELVRLVDAGKVRPPVSELSYTLERTRDAHEQVASGHTRGKIVIQVSSEEEAAREASAPVAAAS